MRLTYLLPAGILGFLWWRGLGDMLILSDRFLYGAVIITLILFIFTRSRRADEGYHVPIKVIKVVDGDTLHAFLHGEKITIRLAFIDAPESAQKEGEAATEYLAKLLNRKRITYLLRPAAKHDGYGRKVVELFADGEDVQIKMLMAGQAFVDVRYSPPWEYTSAFALAQKNKVGVHTTTAVHPQLFRSKEND